MNNCVLGEERFLSSRRWFLTEQSPLRLQSKQFKRFQKVSNTQAFSDATMVAQPKITKSSSLEEVSLSAIFLQGDSFWLRFWII